MHEKIAKEVADIIQPKLKMLNTTSERALQYAEEEIPLLKAILEKLHEKGEHAFDNALNIAIFACIADADISILMVRMVNEQYKYEMALFARIVALSLHEYALDIQRLLKSLIVNELSRDRFSELKNAFYQLNTLNTDFIKQHIKALHSIRNNTVAHKTKQALDLAKMIYEMDPFEIINIGLQMMEISRILKLETSKITAKITA